MKTSEMITSVETGNPMAESRTRELVTAESRARMALAMVQDARRRNAGNVVVGLIYLPALAAEVAGLSRALDAARVYLTSAADTHMTCSLMSLASAHLIIEEANRWTPVARTAR